MRARAEHNTLEYLPKQCYSLADAEESSSRLPVLASPAVAILARILYHLENPVPASRLSGASGLTYSYPHGRLSFPGLEYIHH